MGEIKETEVGDQRPEVGETKKKCAVAGCDRKVVARGFCDTHYTAWQNGRIMHPTEGVYKKVRFSKAGAAKSKPAQGKKAPVKKISGIKTPPGEAKAPRMDAIVVVDLEHYPRIVQQINFLTDKYLVNSEHVIIGLLGEALAARGDRNE